MRDTSKAPSGAAGNGTHGAPADDGSARSDQEFWDERYAQSAHVWSGRPNLVLVREVAGLEPGRALDLGAGEGADAVWLAERGWRVTAVDISPVALEKAARHAAAAGVGERVETQVHDLGASFPEGDFDLVSTHYLHSPREGMPREAILRRAAAAVAPGGLLLVVGHAGLPPWEPADGPHAHVRLPSAREVLASLALPEEEWEVLLAEEFEREVTDPEGRPATRTDNVVTARRLPGAPRR